jgi:hypothetical protein
VPGTSLLEDRSPKSNRRLVLEQSKSTLAEVRQHLVRSSAALNHVYVSPGYTEFAQHDQRKGASDIIHTRVDEGEVAKVQLGTLRRLDSSSSSISSERDKETRVLSCIHREGGREGGMEGERAGHLATTHTLCTHVGML